MRDVRTMRSAMLPPPRKPSRRPTPRALTLLFFFALVWHAWIGVRDILKDYVPARRLRGFLQMLLRVSLIGYAVWATHIFWSI